MRKQNEIKRAVEVLKKHTDPASLAQLDVLQNRRSETWVFIHYVREVPEEERDPALFYAARDAAQVKSASAPSVRNWTMSPKKSRNWTTMPLPSHGKNTRNC